MIDNLSYVYNTRDVPLRYVVKKDYMVDVDDITSEEEILYKAIPNIPMFHQDSKYIIFLIKDITFRTSGEAWIKQVKRVRVSMQNLGTGLWWQV